MKATQPETDAQFPGAPQRMGWHVSCPRNQTLGKEAAVPKRKGRKEEGKEVEESRKVRCGKQGLEDSQE